LTATAKTDLADKMSGLLLGMAVGDALGLPFEGMSRRRTAKMLGPGSLGHRLVFGRGMVSDDTEHACFTAQSLLAAPTDSARFAGSLAWRLRGWLAALPAGVGFGTLRAILKLWLGVSPERSGVRSAGNGAAMRAPVLGACLGRDPERLSRYVLASTRLTHREPRAEEGALVVARAAWHAMRSPSDPIRPETVLDDRIEGDELRRALETVQSCLERNQAPEAFLERMHLEGGVTGYINHTVPAVLYAWLRSPTDFQTCIETTVRMGGDTDTTGAIAGALAGATVGESGIPRDWCDRIIEWPRTTAWMRRLAARLASRFHAAPESSDAGPLPLFWPGILPRNAFFLAVVLAHGFRRLAPPY